MIDKIVYKSNKELTLVFTDRPPVRVTCSEGDVIRLTEWLLGITLQEEVTQCDIILKKV